MRLMMLGVTYVKHLVEITNIRSKRNQLKLDNLLISMKLGIRRYKLLWIYIK